MSQQLTWEYICGKHRYKTTNLLHYHLHIINEHDSEHGLWQKAGTFRFSQRKPIKENGKWGYGKPEVFLGVFRYLPMYSPLNCNCNCNTGSGCWKDPSSCQEPERHQCKTPEEYKDFLRKKWGIKGEIKLGDEV